MPVTGPQHRVFIGIDPSRAGNFGWFPTIDARKETRRERAAFAAARRAETQYATQLRRIVRHIGDLVRGLFDRSDPADPGWTRIGAALNDYARLIEPWANATAGRMLQDVSRRDAAVWAKHGRKIGRGLRLEIEGAPLAPKVAELQQAQVDLITSLPLDVANEIHKLAQEAFVTGRRWEDLVPHIRQELETRAVKNIPEGALSRANLIARTETGRVQANFNAVRAQHIGSEEFIWRAVMDRDTRPLHRELNDRTYRYDDPPILDDGRPGLPGTIWNCRCWAEPVIRDLE